VGCAKPKAKYGRDAVREAAGQSLQNQVSKSRQAATTVPTKTKIFNGERARTNLALRKAKRSFTVPKGQNHPHQPRPNTSP
jgi:hypothetical protein